MNLNELKKLLKREPGKQMQLRLPDGAPVPVSFHITEVGRVQKTFIDCGGTRRQSVTCQIQAWVGQDEDHRIESGKAAAILDKAAAFLPDESVPVEVEYEAGVISQYPIASHEITEDAVILRLTTKHTDCLAKELCGVPALNATGQTSCCGPAGCC